MNDGLPIEQTLRSMHRSYCESSGQLPPFLSCQRLLLEAHNQGFAEDDIRLVVAHLKRENAKFGNGVGYSMRFNKLFEQGPDGAFEHLGSLLGSARADKRAADHKAKHSYPAAKAEVLRATHRPDAPVVPERTMKIGDVLKGIRESL